MPRKVGNRATKVRNRKRKIAAKRASPGSARQDKTSLVPDALSPVTEQRIISNLVSYDREVWPITPAIKQKAVATVERCMADTNGFVANMAVANLVKMEQQTIEANKKEPDAKPVVGVQVNVNQGCPDNAGDLRAGLITSILASAEACRIQPGNASDGERESTGDSGPLMDAGGNDNAAGGDGAGPVAAPPVEFPL